jgi:hypothetical protein
MDDWGRQELEPWLTVRVALPIGPQLTHCHGTKKGRSLGRPRPFRV